MEYLWGVILLLLTPCRGNAGMGVAKLDVTSVATNTSTSGFRPRIRYGASFSPELRDRQESPG